MLDNRQHNLGLLFTEATSLRQQITKSKSRMQYSQCVGNSRFASVAMFSAHAMKMALDVGVNSTIDSVSL
jgi:ABC-type iron transport system FetAB permease component